MRLQRSQPTALIRSWMVVLGVLSLALPISAILPETVGPDPKNSHQAVLLCTAEAITRCAPRRLTGLERRTFAKSRSQRLATASSDHCLENVRLLRNSMLVWLALRRLLRTLTPQWGRIVAARPGWPIPRWACAESLRRPPQALLWSESPGKEPCKSRWEYSWSVV